MAGERLDANGMLVDFKALKLAVEDLIEQYDHAMAVNSEDPSLPMLLERFGDEAVVVFENQEPTTEAMAERLFIAIAAILREGFTGRGKSGVEYAIAPGAVRLERLRVWETPDSWAEFS